MSLPGATDNEKLVALCSKPYKEQIIWFLNAFWNKHEADAERLWEFNNRCAELDLEKHEEGNALDEMAAHRFLEIFKETMTVREMRQKLRDSGAIGEGRVSAVPITHILIFRYNADWRYLVNASQGDNKEDIEKAQKMLAGVQAAYHEASERAGEAARAVIEAESREAASKRAEAEAKQAKEELQVALDEVHAQEEAYNSKKAALEKKSEEGGVVSRNKAKAELAQHLAEDPLPLRKAKITQAAAVKKAERARDAAAEATKRATEAKNESIKAKKAAEDALEEAKKKLKEAEAYLEEVKSRPGQAQGAIWWIERELHEAKAYKPESKGGYRKQ